MIAGGNQAVAITTAGGDLTFGTSDVILHNDAATTITTGGGAVNFGSSTTAIKLESDGGDNDSLTQLWSRRCLILWNNWCYS